MRRFPLLLVGLTVTIGLGACSSAGTTSQDVADVVEVEEGDTSIIFQDNREPEEIFPWTDLKDKKPQPDNGGEDVGDLEDMVEVEDAIEDEMEDKAPDHKEVVIDTDPCKPSCTGKICGADGCGGVCGFCEYGYLCDDGKCEPSGCPAQCVIKVVGDKDTYKECGPNGCGGYCGFCMDDKYCGDDGFCYAGSCAGSCGTKKCGDDGCGHSCGNCLQGEICQGGKCVPNPCGDVTYKGKCTDKYTLVECVNYQLIETYCKKLPDRQCGWDQNVGKYSCVLEGMCEPQCMFADDTPKECGDDGCWGSCGTCPQGWGCAAGICEPAEGGACAWIDNVVGACSADNKVRWFCSAGLLYGYDCKEKEGVFCGWKASANLGAGGYDCL